MNNAHKYEVTESGRHFEIFHTPYDGCYLVIELIRTIEEDGDAESGPSLDISYEPVVVGRGHGMMNEQEAHITIQMYIEESKA